MGNVKFALDTGPDATSSSWLKYVRSAPSFEEQNLAACHLTGDQVSAIAALFYSYLCSYYVRNTKQNNINHWKAAEGVEAVKDFSSLIVRLM